jgi:hypothetical protein
MQGNDLGATPERGPATGFQRFWKARSLAGTGAEVSEGATERLAPWLLAAFALLVGLSDVLFLDHAPGLSLAVFAAVLAAVVRLACGPRSLATGDAATLALLALTILPVVELVQGLSLAVLLVGTVAVAVRIAFGPPAPAGAVWRGMVQFLGRFPGMAVRGAGGGIRAVAQPGGRRVPLRSLALAWLLPGVAGLVLVGLLLAANPVLSLWAERLGQVPFHPHAAIRHALFCALAGVLIWPFVALGRDRGWLGRRPEAADPSRPLLLQPAWVNEVSIRNSLVLFNLLLGLQTLLDLGYLWGGVELPNGVTAAQYAHRGAYPLVATALLAGGFTLVSRPFAAARPGLRILLGLWIAQNLLLVVSSLLRLDLYVGAFGLTRLRLAAAVWMGLVAGGLALTAWQVGRGRDNGWLLRRVALMAGAVLYLCCFVNAADLIARVNLGRYAGTGAIDMPYLCKLGEGAGPAIRAYEMRTGVALCPGRAGVGLRAAPPEDWRDWGFRNWRLRHYAEAVAGTGENR